MNRGQSTVILVNESGGGAPPPPMSLAPTWAPTDEAIVALWLHGRSAATQRAYRATVARFVVAVDKPLAAVTLADLQRYADLLIAQKLSLTTQKCRLAALKSLFAFAHGSGYLAGNVTATVRLPAVRERLAERIPSEDDIVALLAAEPNRRNHALIRLLYVTGLRLSEACALCWRDLQPRGEEGQVSVWGKGEKARTVLVTAGTWREMILLRPPHAHPDDPVFRSRHGGPLSTGRGWTIVKLAARRAGLEAAAAFSPHWLRHAHASHALDHGAPISLVRDGLGHASLATTSRYVHARPGDGSGRYLPL